MDTPSILIEGRSFDELEPSESEPESPQFHLRLVVGRLARAGCLTAAVGVFRARDIVKRSQHVVLIALASVLPAIYRTAVWLDPALTVQGGDNDQNERQLVGLFWTGATLSIGPRIDTLQVHEPDLNVSVELEDAAVAAAMLPPRVLPPSGLLRVRTKASMVSLHLGRRQRLQRKLRRRKSPHEPKKNGPNLQACTPKPASKLIDIPNPVIEPSELNGLGVTLNATTLKLDHGETNDGESNGSPVHTPKQGKLHVWLPYRRTPDKLTRS